MKNFIRMTIGFLASTVLCTPILAQSHVDSSLSNEMLMEQEIARINAPVQSQSDLRSYQALNLQTALNNLPVNSRRDFLDSLTFSEKGLASFRYDILEQELTPTKIHGVLSMFGLEHGTGQFENAKIETLLDRAILESFATKTQPNDGKNLDLSLSNESNTQNKSGFDPSQFGGTSSSFGVSISQGPFLEGYICAGKGSCRIENDYACTSNC